MRHDSLSCTVFYPQINYSKWGKIENYSLYSIYIGMQCYKIYIGLTRCYMLDSIGYLCYFFSPLFSFAKLYVQCVCFSRILCILNINLYQVYGVYTVCPDVHIPNLYI